MEQFGEIAPSNEAVNEEVKHWKEVRASEAVVKATPAGTLHHRIWSCKSTECDRKELVPADDLFRARAGIGIGPPAWERALVPRPPPPRRNSKRVKKPFAGFLSLREA